MNRWEIKQAIASMIMERQSFDDTSEKILQFLEDIGFDYERSISQRDDPPGPLKGFEADYASQ